MDTNLRLTFKKHKKEGEMDRKKFLIWAIVILCALLALLFVIKRYANSDIDIEHLDMNQPGIQVYQTTYNSSSSCRGSANNAVIDCDCSIMIDKKNYKYKNTLNSVSCDDSIELCGYLCDKFVEDLTNK